MLWRGARASSSIPSSAASSSSKPMLTITDPEDFRRFREVFDRADYTDEGLIGTLGPIQLPTHPGADLPHFLHLTRQGRPLDTLIRLFLIGAPVGVEAARGALDPVPIEEWVEAGLLEVKNDQAAGLVRLMHFRGLLLVVDQPARPEIDGQPDQVMALTASTATLAFFAVLRPARQALDLGTGSGILALLAARQSQQVYATDTNPRALSFARFNAGLNACSNVHLLEGDSFEPVRGQKFDLVLSNPPFAVTPSRRYLYRDSGLGGDRFCRSIIAQAPEFLEEGGLCQIVCDWVHLAGQDWKERLAGWFEGSGCDAWVLRTDTHDAAGYAHMWIRDTEHGSPETSARLYEEWTAYYQRERIEAISSGVIALRRSSGHKNWVRIEEMPEGTTGPIGDYVALGFQLRDYLETAASDQELLEEKLRFAPDAVLDQQSDWSQAGWRVKSSQIRHTRGIKYAGTVDRHMTSLLARCDGRRPLRDLLVHMAVDLGADLEQIVPGGLPMVRQLIEHGFLLPGKLQPSA